MAHLRVNSGDCAEEKDLGNNSWEHGQGSRIINRAKEERWSPRQARTVSLARRVWTLKLATYLDIYHPRWVAEYQIEKGISVHA